VAWSVDPDGVAGKFALLTASSSLQHSLVCGAHIASLLGHDEEARAWRASAARLAYAVAHRPNAFALKGRWAMDWYYPVLTGAITREAATRRMYSRWSELVVPDLGTRCVADKLWVTAAESAECAIAAGRSGWKAEAEELLRWTRHFRADDGGYWTGCVHPDCVRFPAGQKSTYSAAAVVIADHVLYQRTLAAAIFSEGWPPWVELAEVGPATDPAYEAGSPSFPMTDRSSLTARRPEPMHAGTPTPL
jgi:hypothetical protein